VWTGKLAVFIGNNPDVGARVAAYNPATNQWSVVADVNLDAQPTRQVPGPQGSIMVVGGGSPVGSLAWDGRDVLVFAPPDFPNYAVDPDSLQAPRIDSPPAKPTCFGTNPI